MWIYVPRYKGLSDLNPYFIGNQWTELMNCFLTKFLLISWKLLMVRTAEDNIMSSRLEHSNNVKKGQNISRSISRVIRVDYFFYQLVLIKICIIKLRWSVIKKFWWQTSIISTSKMKQWCFDIFVAHKVTWLIFRVFSSNLQSDYFLKSNLH